MTDKEKTLHRMLAKVIALNNKSAYDAATAVIVALNNNYTIKVKENNFLDNYKE